MPEYGWNCTVCTPENPDFDLRDPGLETEIHPDTEVLKLPIWEPYGLFRTLHGQKSLAQGVTPKKGGAFARFIRGNIFIPDPRRFWVSPAVKFLTQYLKDRKVDVIITTGPPHSMHLIGLELKRKLGIPWIADFRDPWSRWDMLAEFNTTDIARRWHRSLERKVVTKADGVIAVSEQWAKEMQEDHGILPKVITNGFDAEDFKENTASFPKKFTVVHAGLLNSFRNVPALWQVLSELKQDGRLPDMEVRLLGMVDPDVKDQILELPIGQDVTFGTSVSHQEIVRIYDEAAVLLLFMNNTPNAKGHIPGKLFEYLAAGRWILGFGDPAGEAAGILKKTGRGKVVAWDDEEGIKEILLKYHQHFQAQQYPTLSDIQNFSRKELTRKLSQYLFHITDQSEE